MQAIVSEDNIIQLIVSDKDAAVESTLLKALRYDILEINDSMSNKNSIVSVIKMNVVAEVIRNSRLILLSNG
ncbi:MAG: hypothetical protein K2M56_08665 [Muribaculaceae bacterium]|nr:hypothetical protein [Muribaculaceae bacterium]